MKIKVTLDGTPLTQGFVPLDFLCLPGTKTNALIGITDNLNGKGVTLNLGDQGWHFIEAGKKLTFEFKQGA